MRLVILTFTALILSPALDVQAAPSFDCSKASTRVENLICDNPELAQLDSEMAKFGILKAEGWVRAHQVPSELPEGLRPRGNFPVLKYWLPTP